jgi:hypothetical protein
MIDDVFVKRETGNWLFDYFLDADGRGGVGMEVLKTVGICAGAASVRGAFHRFIGSSSWLWWFGNSFIQISIGYTENSRPSYKIR